MRVSITYRTRFRIADAVPGTVTEVLLMTVDLDGFLFGIRKIRVFGTDLVGVLGLRNRYTDLNASMRRHRRGEGYLFNSIFSYNR